MDPIRIEDDGYVQFEIGDSVQMIDVWAVNNHLVDLQSSNESVDAFHAAVVEYMQQLGFPQVSHRCAGRFCQAVYEQAGTIEKKGVGEAGSASPMPGSADSTDSPSGS